MVCEIFDAVTIIRAALERAALYLNPASASGQTIPLQVFFHWVDSQPLGSRVMKHLSDAAASPLRRQAADALRRARRLPVGPDRNDLRQSAIVLLWFDKDGHAEGAHLTALIGTQGKIKDLLN